jgi:gluconate kinase
MNNSKKPIVICLFGFMAVGKLTIGQKLHEKIGINFCHNHLLNDYISAIFPRGSKERGPLIEHYELELLEKLAESGGSLIMTHAYASDYKLHNGNYDIDHVENMELIVQKYGGDFYGIHLVADQAVILERVPNESRANFKKLLDPQITKKCLEETPGQESPNLKNLLKIDTGKQSVEDAVYQIIDFIKQKQA